MTEPSPQKLTVDGCEIAYRRAGKGAPLLYLHGAGGGSMWFPFQDELAARFDVIAPEHPGFGRSETPDWLDSVGDLAFFYLDVIKTLKLDGIHVVGHSLGGWLAAEIAVRDSSAISSLSLVAPAGIHVKGLKRNDLFLMNREELQRSLFFDQKYAEANLARVPSDEEMDWIVKNSYATARLAWEPRLHNPHLAKWLHRISVPTQILFGDSDALIPPQHGPAYRDLIPGSKLVTFEKCGHIPQVEKQQEFIAAIVTFVGEKRS